MIDKLKLKLIFIGDNPNLTYGKEYEFMSFTSYKHTLIDDSGDICSIENEYLNKYFCTINTWIRLSRDQKIKNLGI